MSKKLPDGFTLIELMVTISLIAILFGIGVASYIDFSRRQLVFTSARKIVQDLRFAQSLAANNQKPQLPDQTPDPNCGTLEGYTFSISGTTKIYEIDVNCSGPLYTNKVKEGSVPSDLTLTGFTQVKFKILNQARECKCNSNPCNPCQLVVTGFNNTKTVMIGAGGVIKIVGE